MKLTMLVKFLFFLLLGLSESDVYCMNQEIINSLSSVELQNQVESILAEPIQSDWLFWAKKFFMACGHARAYALIELASTTDNDDDVRKLLILAGQYKSFGYIDISLWLPGGGLLIDTHEIDIRENPISLVVENEQFKKLAEILMDKNKKILQEHLVLALFLKKESMAELFVLLGADINTPIENGVSSLSLAKYARKQEMNQLANLIEQRMVSIAEEYPITAYLRTVMEKIL